jgi:hypothetical protein
MTANTFIYVVRRVIGVDAGARSELEKPLKPPMSEGLDHSG